MDIRVFLAYLDVEIILFVLLCFFFYLHCCIYWKKSFVVLSIWELSLMSFLNNAFCNGCLGLPAL